MKITINTETKTITLLESCKFSEVQELIEELGGEWNIEINQTSSIDWTKLTTRDTKKDTPYNPYDSGNIPLRSYGSYSSTNQEDWEKMTNSGDNKESINNNISNEIMNA